jgi:hypothetical protein
VVDRGSLSVEAIASLGLALKGARLPAVPREMLAVSKRSTDPGLSAQLNAFFLHSVLGNRF